MAEAEEEEVQENTAAVFVEILDLFVPFPYSVLTTTMFNSEVVAEQWEQFMSSAQMDNCSSKIQNGLNVAIAILNLSFEGNMSDETPIFMTTAAKYVEYLLGLLRAPDSAQSGKSFNMTFGKLTPPFGFLRLKILEFIAALVNTRYASILHTLWDNKDLFTTLLDVLLFYKWNNTLHFFVSQIFGTILAIGSAAEIVSVLIEHCHLPSKVIHAFDTETTRSVGYLGHLSEISNALQSAADKNEELKKVLDASDNWKRFLSGKLKEVNRLNTLEIAGGKPVNTLGNQFSEEMISQFSMMGGGGGGSSAHLGGFGGVSTGGGSGNSSFMNNSGNGNVNDDDEIEDDEEEYHNSGGNVNSGNNNNNNNNNNNDESDDSNDDGKRKRKEGRLVEKVIKQVLMLLLIL